MNQEAKNMIAQLDILSQKTNDNWVASLSERKIAERDFANKMRNVSNISEAKQEKDTYEKLYGNKKYYNTVGVSRKYTKEWLAENTPGRICLDYACGNGGNTIRMAELGAELSIGIDISDLSVENAKSLAGEANVSENTYFLQADCENTGLADNSIDTIICSGVLHHMDLHYAYPELYRILKKGGKIIAIEALNYNPVIKQYRNRTENMRTEWEKNHILSYKDLKLAKEYGFSVKNIKHWHLFSILGVKAPSMLPFFNAIDKVVLKIPGIKLMSWMFSFELVKE